MTGGTVAKLSRRRRFALALAGFAGHLVRWLGILARAIPGLLGGALLAYGAHLVYPPAGYIVAGVLLLGDVLWTRRAEQIRAERLREPRKLRSVA